MIYYFLHLRVIATVTPLARRKTSVSKRKKSALSGRLRFTTTTSADVSHIHQMCFLTFNTLKIHHFRVQ